MALAQPRADHYGALGLSRDATAPQIRAAYKAAVRTHHPDKGGTGDAGTLAALKAAHDVLLDDMARKHYDASLADDPTLAWLRQRPQAARHFDSMYNEDSTDWSSFGTSGCRLRSGGAYAPPRGEEVTLDFDNLPF